MTVFHPGVIHKVLSYERFHNGIFVVVLNVDAGRTATRPMVKTLSTPLRSHCGGHMFTRAARYSCNGEIIVVIFGTRHNGRPNAN